MFNCLLDGFPTDYKGYPIRTSFRIGILINLLFDDDSVDDDMKFLQAMNLLYDGERPDDIQVAIEGIFWFLSCGKSELYLEDDYKEESSPDKGLDFTLDHLDIWGAFWSKGIDLDKEDMHWFKFISALGNLGDCQLTQKMQFRTTNLGKMKGETRKFYAEMKEKYKVRKVVTKEEHEEYVKKLAETNGSYYMKLRQLNS